MTINTLNIKKLAISSIGLLLLSFNAVALDPVEKVYAEKLVHGGSSTVRSTANSIQNIKEVDQELYDIAAAVLLRDYKTAQNKTEVDSLSWITKALLSSYDSRYLPVLKEVSANAANKKLRKYGKSTFKKLTKAAVKSSPSFNVSNVNLGRIKKGSGRIGGKQNINIIKVGMGAGEVYELCGRPTSESSSMTGKVFIPFNYSGKGNIRSSALYKGQGSIIFENTSSYTSGRRVVDIILDTYESGYR